MSSKKISNKYRIFRVWLNYLFCVCFSLILLGCATSGVPIPKPVAPIVNPETVKIEWTSGVLNSNANGSFVPVMDNDVLFAADANGLIVKLDSTDGTIIQKIRTKYELSSGVAVSPDSIFVTTANAELLALDKITGNVKWKAVLPTVSIETPQVSGSVVVVKTNDAGLSAYNTATGTLLWIYQKSNSPLTLRAHNTFQIIPPEVLALGQPGGVLVLLNLSNGNAIWQNYIAIPEGASELEKLTDIAMRPVIKDKEICVASYNGKIACLDAISSNILWSKQFSSSEGVLIDDQNVYSVSNAGVVYAFDKYSGATVWKNNALQYRKLSTPAFLNNTLLIVDGEGYINLFNCTDGQLVARVSSSLKGGISFPWSDGNKVILQSGNGNIAAITQ